MPNSAHLSTETLDLLADGALGAAEEAEARAHLAFCARCIAEFESVTALFASLSTLPRFEPSAGFMEAVLARVEFATAPSPLAEWLQAHLPSTRRGWTWLAVVLSIPFLVMAGAIGWLLTHPLVTPSGLWNVTREWAGDLASRGVAAGFDFLLGSGALQAALDGVAVVRDAAGGPFVFAFFGLAALTPLALWLLTRLLRAPEHGLVHAR